MCECFIAAVMVQLLLPAVDSSLIKRGTPISQRNRSKEVM